MIATLGAICAAILRMKKFVPDWDRLITETHWQGSTSGRWYEHYMPVTYEYGHHEAKPIGVEVALFIICAVTAWWAWKNRNNSNKESAGSARFILMISVPLLVILPMVWLARQHLEGDWTAVRPNLMSRTVETPEYLAAKAEREAYWRAETNVRKGLTPEGVKIWHKACILY